MRIPLVIVCVATLLIGYFAFENQTELSLEDRWNSCQTINITSEDNIRNSTLCDTISSELERNESIKSRHDQDKNEETYSNMSRAKRWSTFLRQAIFPAASAPRHNFGPVHELRAFLSEQFYKASLLRVHNRSISLPDNTQPSVDYNLINSNLNFETNGSSVNRFFLALGWAHFVVALWIYDWSLYVTCFILVCFGLVRLARYLKLFELMQWVKLKLENILYFLIDCSKLNEEEKIAFWEALIPKPVQGLYTLLIYCDRKLRLCLDSWLDTVVSFVILILVIVGFCLLAIFLAFQIHEESIRLVSLTGNLLNEVLQSEAYSWLPKKEQLDNLMSLLVTNVYQAGRSWISDKTKEMFESDPTNKALFEKQMLDVWETIYNTFINQTAQVPTLSGSDSMIDMNAPNSSQLNKPESNFFANLFWNNASIFNRHDFSSLFVVIKQNLGTLAAIIESVWSLTKSNLTLIASVLTASVSLILSGGNVAMNFIISLLIFLTVLFYLLAASGSIYLPIAFITSLTPTDSGTSSIINQFYTAVESAISGVFAATMKLAVFYGLYTLLTHTIFNLDILVIPSVLAALFGAIPILGTYWAAIPGAIELIFVKQSITQSCILIGLHLLPTYFVDVAVYREIKGAGHPYLTGLAIAGGLYCQGPEGALTGPITLCCLLVGVNLYRWALDSNTTELVHNLLGINPNRTAYMSNTFGTQNIDRKKFSTSSTRIHPSHFDVGKSLRQTPINAKYRPSIHKPMEGRSVLAGISQSTSIDETESAFNQTKISTPVMLKDALTSTPYLHFED